MFATKFIYDLTGQPDPEDDELDDELDRLLFVKGVEKPNYLVPTKERDRRTTEDQISHMDSEVLSLWIKRRFEPALILLLLQTEDNYKMAKSELVKMERYRTWIEKMFRAHFVERHAMQRIRELCFDDRGQLKTQRVVMKLKRTLTFLSKHLEHYSPDHMTLQNTEAYTSADVTLYNYLKRIVVGRYKDSGLKSHVKLCDPLIRFMNRYATKNTHVINVTVEDPLANPAPESNLLADATKPAVIAMAIVFFYLWRRGN